MPKVLIVDDAAFMRMMLKDILIKNGYEIAGEVSNGVEAVSMYKEAKPDIVTMDITMPEMDGITALKEILTINFAQERFLLELMFGIIIPNVSSGSGSDGQTRSDQFG